MKNKLEDIFYFFTLWFCSSVIILGIIGLMFKLITHLK